MIQLTLINNLEIFPVLKQYPRIFFFSTMDLIALTILYLMFIIFLSQVIKWAYEHLALRKKLSSIPGPDSLPFIGLAWKLKNIPVESKNNNLF